MAKINEDMIVIKVSEIVRDNDPTKRIMDDEIIAQIEAVIQELVGAGRIVEVIEA